jgi:hypothetical protein
LKPFPLFAIFGVVAGFKGKTNLGHLMSNKEKTSLYITTQGFIKAAMNIRYYCEFESIETARFIQQEKQCDISGHVDVKGIDGVFIKWFFDVRIDINSLSLISIKTKQF